MAAIITEKFRNNSRKKLMEDIADINNTYYISIGKQNNWAELNLNQSTPVSPLPLGTSGDAIEVRNNISSMFKLINSKVSDMLPNHIIQPDRNYKVYNPYDPTCFYASADQFPCFVVSRKDSLGGGTGDHVFLCIGKSHTSTTPHHSYNHLGSSDQDTDRPGLFSYQEDGYRWLYIGKYKSTYTDLNNAAFVAYDFEQDVMGLDLNDTYSPGIIHGFHIINSGYGLTNALGEDVTVKVIGLKDGVKTVLDVPCKLNIQNNKVVKISITSDINSGNNYKFWSKATASITTGTYATTGNVVITPIISPIDGYENNLEMCLPNWYIGVGADTLSAQFVPNGMTYRQIAIVKNPKRNNGLPLNNQTVDIVHKSFSLTSNIDERLVVGGLDVESEWKLKQGDFNIATISCVELKNNKLNYYYYNSLSAGIFDIDPTLPLTIIPPSNLNLTSLLTLQPSEYIINDSNNLYDKNSGEILFIDNRGAVTREPGQNEEIKIIIQL